MLIHNVYFWAKEGLSDADKAALGEGLASLCGYELVRSGHSGVPAGTTRDVVDRSYTFGPVLIFDNQDDQDAYQISPIHRAFVAEHAAKWDRVVVYDVETC